MNEGAVTGWAAGVPFTALPPRGPGHPKGDDNRLVVTWHMMDAPRSDAAFAAALPLNGVNAWRVHLGMPRIGRRAYDGAYEAAVDDPMLQFTGPVVDQATDEFPAALAAVREQLQIQAAPIAIVGGSMGGTVALSVLARYPQIPIAAVALINPAIRARTAVEVFSASLGHEYAWSDVSRAEAERLDFVAVTRATRKNRAPYPPVLIVSGEFDYPVSRVDAHELLEVVTGELMTIPGLDHPIARQPGTEPAPQIAAAKLVDAAVTEWFEATPSRG